MSKLYSIYESLKKENNETIYLFKSGIFYIALSNDAIYLSNKFNFKLTNLNDSIVKCGFPISCVEKYINIFSSYNINFKIVNCDINTIYSPKEYQLNQSTQDILKCISSVNTDSLSISEVYNFINDLKSKCKKILEQL